MPSYFKKPNTIYRDPVNGERWYQEDLANAAEALNVANAKNAEAVKDAKGRGVKPGISSETGRIIPPPPGYDPLADKVCQGPGLVKNGFGQSRICARRATAFLQVAHFTPDVPDSPSTELIEASLASYAYGGPNPIPAASGKRKGSMVADPMANGRPVCAFHAQSLYRESIHPEDGGTVPEMPKLTGDVVMGLDALTPGRPFRCVSQDSNFVWVTDGMITVMAHRADYVRLLREYGLLPEDSTVPLP